MFWQFTKLLKFLIMWLPYLDILLNSVNMWPLVPVAFQREKCFCFRACIPQFVIKRASLARECRFFTRETFDQSSEQSRITTEAPSKDFVTFYVKNNFVEIKNHLLKITSYIFYLNSTNCQVDNPGKTRRKQTVQKYKPSSTWHYCNSLFLSLTEFEFKEIAASPKLTL